MPDELSMSAEEISSSAPAMPMEAAEPKKAGRISAILGCISDVSMIALAVLIPVWLLPITLDILELNKQTLLAVLVLVGVLACVGKSLADKTISISRSWLHLVVLFFLGGYAVTSYMSVDRYISYVGNVGQMQYAFITIASFVLMYSLIVHRFRTPAAATNLILWFIVGSLLAGLYGILSAFGLHIGTGVMLSQGFNTVGTMNALGTFLAIPMVLAATLLTIGAPAGSYLASKKKWVSMGWMIKLYAMIAIGLVLAVLIDFWPVWVELIVGGLLIAGVEFLHNKKLSLRTMILAGAMVVVSAGIWIAPTPASFSKFVPGEVSPSFKHSMMIAQSTLRDNPLFGSGPGTWIYDYARYRSVAVNVSQFWTIRFERGISSAMTMVAMLGIVGSCLWLLLIASVLVFGIRLVLKTKDEDERKVAALAFIGWVTVTLLAFLYNFNVAHHFAFWLLLAIIAALVSKRSFEWKQVTSPWITSVLSIVIIFVGVGTVSGGWLMAQRLTADAKFSGAVSAYTTKQNIDASIVSLKEAIALNPFNDGYYRNLSQAYLIKIDQMTQQNKQPSKDQVDQINSMIMAAVDSAKKAISANPTNVDNYSNLAATYRAIMSFTSGADEFAINAYMDALAHEPNNPVFMDEIGKIYVLRSDAYRTALNSKDEKQKTDAQTGVTSELDKAADWFNKAIAVKPDYTPSHFNLGLVYERQGKLDDAIRKLEDVLKQTPKDATVAFQLATLYERNNQTDQARIMFEQIVAAQPDNANARWLLSMIYEQAKQYDKAIEQVQAVKSTNADNATVDQRLQLLQKEKAAPVGSATSTAATNSTSTAAVAPVPQPQSITSQGAQNPIKR